MEAGRRIEIRLVRDLVPFALQILLVNLRQVSEYRVSVGLDGEHFVASCDDVSRDGATCINRTREGADAILNGAHGIDWCFSRGLANAASFQDEDRLLLHRR